MLTYCYAWTPIVLIASFSVLAVPWLGFLALLVLVAGALVLVAGLISAIVWAPVTLGRAIRRRWIARIQASGQLGGIEPWATAARQATGSRPVTGTVLAAGSRARRDR